MERLDVIQHVIDTRKLSTYLEIGVLGGHVFFKVNCRRKIAVDPHFRFNWRGRLGETIRNPVNVMARYFETTSDVFFEKHAPRILREGSLDVVLIDGMHAFDYVNRDIENALRFLSQRGVIVLHDCNPLTADAACTFEEWKQRGYTGYWNGDVWKSIIHTRVTRQDLDVFVADCDHGLGIMTRRTSSNGQQALPLTADEIRKMTFSDLARNRVSLLNLKPAEFLSTFLDVPGIG